MTTAAIRNKLYDYIRVAVTNAGKEPEIFIK